MSDGIERAYSESERRRIAEEWYDYEPPENEPMSQPATPWIDVMDRLPDSDRTVVLWDADAPETGVSVGMYDAKGWGGGRWYEFDGDESYTVDVTHWHELPAPPVTL